MESLRLKLKFLPLLKKQFELKELVLYTPTVNVSRSKAGVFNFDDLTRPKKLTKEEQAELEKEKAEEAKDPKKPFTVDDIPVAISIGKVGFKDGTVNYYDGGLNQKFQIYKMTAMVYGISIDPKDLEKKDNAKLKIYMGVKNVGPVRSGSVDSFDVTLDVTGNVKPFDLKTRRLDPEVSVHAGSPEGMFTGPADIQQHCREQCTHEIPRQPARLPEREAVVGGLEDGICRCLVEGGRGKAFQREPEAEGMPASL